MNEKSGAKEIKTNQCQNEDDCPTPMWCRGKDRAKEPHEINCFSRLVLWVTGRIEVVTAMIERRNMRVALRVVCHAQMWLRALGYTNAANMMEEPIREIAKVTVKITPQNATVEARREVLPNPSDG
jgi:hypothetical protein